MAHVSEYEVETKFIDKLESIGYEYVEIKNYPQLLGNLQTQLAKFNAQKLIDAKGKAELSASEFGRILVWLDNKSVYESAKLLRDKYILTLETAKPFTLISFPEIPTATFIR